MSTNAYLSRDGTLRPLPKGAVVETIRLLKGLPYSRILRLTDDRFVGVRWSAIKVCVPNPYLEYEGKCLEIGRKEAESLIQQYGVEQTLDLSKPPEVITACDAPQRGGDVMLPDLVTLDQAAALVNRSSDALRHYRSKSMPKPYVRGTKGKPNEFLWSEMRPWLENTFGRKIPDVAILKFRTSLRKILDQ